MLGPTGRKFFLSLVLAAIADATVQLACPMMTSLLSPEAFAATTYDYVIAGGGTAGLTLAVRLTKDPRFLLRSLKAVLDHSGDLEVLAWGFATDALGQPAVVRLEVPDDTPSEWLHAKAHLCYAMHVC